MTEIHIGWMYPDLLNLHGERGDVQALERCGENLGIKVIVHRIEDMDDQIPFDELDMLIFLPGEVKSAQWLCPALEKQHSQLESYLNKGGYILAVGTSGLMFGEKIIREDGTTIPGLGLLDLVAKERKYVLGDDLHFCIDGTKQEVMGLQIHMADVTTSEPLGRTLYGYGNNGTGTEGARRGNLIYTNCVGPLLVKNPWLAETLLKDIALKKYMGIEQAKPYTLAQKSFDTCLNFVNGKQKQ